MNERKSTRYPGVQVRESASRKYKGKPDLCFTIDYRDESGKRIRKDVGWASQGFTAALASEMRAKLVHEVKVKAALGDNAILPQSAIPTFGEAWNKYHQDWLLPNGKDAVGPASIVKNYLGALLQLPLNKITPYHVDQVMNEMRHRGLSSQTIRHTVSLVGRIIRKMIQWKLYTGSNPVETIKLPKLNNLRERFLTPQEAHQLLSEIRSRSERTWLMSLISLHCGMRFGEIAKMRWEQVSFPERSIYIPESKSGKARHAVMTQEVADALANLPNKTGLVFPSNNATSSQNISKAFFRAVDACGLNTLPDGAKITDRRQKVVFHTLRHTYASWLAKSGQTQLTIADRLGHHSLQMSMRYTHLMDESRRKTADAISAIFHTPPPDSQ